jgi:hypothetical protein
MRRRIESPKKHTVMVHTATFVILKAMKDVLVSA